MRWWTLGVWLVAGLVVVAAASAGKPERDPTARNLVRLSDLGPGYVLGDDPGCGIGPTYEGASPRLRRFNDKHRKYHGCAIDFLELWRPPGTGSRPEQVESVAIRFRRLADARAALRIGPDFAEYNFGVPARSLQRVVPARPVGDEFRMYRTSDAVVNDTPRRPALLVVWRTGRTMSLMLVSGKADAVNQEGALRLTEIQQSRVVKPTPLPANANDDRFVSLNDPALDVPVHWLGPRFRAPGLPPLAFDKGYAMGDEEGPGYAAQIIYPGVDLGIWSPAVWARFIKSRTGRLVWTARCTKATRDSLPTGYAVLFSGHTRHQKRCGRRPDRFLAHVYLPGTVVSVNVPNCRACIERGRGADRWNSLRGMRAIVKGLRIRPRE